MTSTAEELANQAELLRTTMAFFSSSTGAQRSNGGAPGKSGRFGKHGVNVHVRGEGGYRA